MSSTPETIAACRAEIEWQLAICNADRKAAGQAFAVSLQLGKFIAAARTGYPAVLRAMQKLLDAVERSVESMMKLGLDPACFTPSLTVIADALGVPRE